MKSKYDWFVVVRDPYDRCISEFHCLWGGPGKNTEFFTRDEFNAYLQMKIKGQKNIYARKGYRGHWLKQVRYLDPLQTVHVLHFENLEKEFNELMEEYGIDLKLSLHENGQKKKFGRDDLDAETIALINREYKEDFDTFGYEMMEPESTMMYKTRVLHYDNPQ